MPNSKSQTGATPRHPVTHDEVVGKAPLQDEVMTNIVEYPTIEITLQKIGRVSKAHVRELLRINYNELAILLKELTETNESFQKIYTAAAARRHYLTADMVVTIMQSAYGKSKIKFVLPETIPKHKRKNNSE